MGDRCKDECCHSGLLSVINGRQMLDLIQVVIAPFF